MVVVSAGHVGGTHGTISSAADILWMSVVSGMRGIGRVCVWFKAPWVERGVKGLSLCLANPGGTGGVLNVWCGWGVGKELGPGFEGVV